MSVVYTITEEGQLLSVIPIEKYFYSVDDYKELTVISVSGDVMLTGKKYDEIWSCSGDSIKFKMTRNSKGQVLQRLIKSYTVNGRIFLLRDCWDKDYGLYYSDDKGETWLEPKININEQIKFITNTYNGLLAFSAKNVYSSMDNGDTWQIKDLGTQFNWFVHGESEGNDVYFTSAQGKKKSFISGMYHYNGLNVPVLINNTRLSGFKIDSTRIIGHIVDDLYFSPDMGNTMTKLNLPMDLPKNYFISDYAINDKYLFLVSNGFLYRSGNNGETWEKINGWYKDAKKSMDNLHIQRQLLADQEKKAWEEAWAKKYKFESGVKDGILKFFEGEGEVFYGNQANALTYYNEAINLCPYLICTYQARAKYFNSKQLFDKEKEDLKMIDKIKATDSLVSKLEFINKQYDEIGLKVKDKNSIEYARCYYKDEETFKRLYQSGPPESRIFYLTKLINLNPNNDRYYYERAHNYNVLKKFGNAIADYDKAHQLNPKNQRYQIGKIPRKVLVPCPRCKGRGSYYAKKTVITTYYTADAIGQNRIERGSKQEEVEGSWSCDYDGCIKTFPDFGKIEKIVYDEGLVPVY
ncbi:MAG: hypothetical protein ACK40G_00835 [Cytophagaceae bacterium]